MPRTPSTPPDSKNPPPPGRFHVLVLDDDDAIRKLVVKTLTSEGYAVSSAATVQRAAEIAASLKSPILVVDKNLQGNTGLEFIAELRQVRDDFEAVLMTAHADVDSLVQSVELGVFRCVTKPFALAEMVAAVAGAANRLFLRLDLRARKLELEARNQELEASLAQLRESESKRRQSERLASIGQFAAGVAHEINNPLAYIAINLELIAEEVAALSPDMPPARAKELRELVGDAQTGAKRVQGIVRDVQTFARGDDQSTSPVDVVRVVESSLRMVSNELRHQAKVVTSFGAAPPVDGNESRLAQVVLNLLMNAAQAIPEGCAREHEIRIGVRTDAEDRAVIEVSDTGVGVPDEVRARIFDPFFTTKAVGGGTGLGLSICHGIVSGLGGEIEVESEPGRGSTFRVLLPPSHRAATPSLPARRPAAMPERARLLVIDDDVTLLASLRRLLSREFDVTATPSAQRAINFIRAGQKFDVVLCDLMMTEMSGMDFYAEVALIAPALMDRLVFMSGGAFTPRAREFLDTLPLPQFGKPLDAKRLRQVLHERARPPA